MDNKDKSAVDKSYRKINLIV